MSLLFLFLFLFLFFLFLFFLFLTLSSPGSISTGSYCSKASDAMTALVARNPLTAMDSSCFVDK